MLRVLIAEDSIILADILEHFLVSGGFEVCGIATNVSDAVALADLHQPDLAVFDFQLAGGELGSQIRARLKNKSDIGILYATGTEMNGALTKSDGEAYIQKPYSMKDMHRALHLVHESRLHGKVLPGPIPGNFHFLDEVLEQRIVA